MPLANLGHPVRLTCDRSEELQTICFRCGVFDLPLEDGRLRCLKCGYSIPRTKYNKMIDYGSRIMQHGIRYRIIYEDQIAKHGQIVRKYSLVDPTLIETVAAIVVSGILGNAAYDAVKSTLKTMYAEIRNRRDKASSSRPGRSPTAEDERLIHRLIGNDPHYEGRFVSYSKDYVNQRKSAIPAAALACAEEMAIDRCSNVFKNDPAIYVFASATGRRFHRKNCKFLRRPTRRLRLKSAMLALLTPCRMCKPNDRIAK